MAQEKKEIENEQIELFSYDPIIVVRDVVKRWYLIVAAAILMGMAAFVYTEVTYVPRYSTTTTFVVNARDSSSTVYQNLAAATDLASVFSEMLNSSIMRGAILEAVEIPHFGGTIQAAAIAETNLLTVTVTDDNPRTAFLVARAVIENHQVVSYQVMGDTILDVLQDPMVPTAPSNPMNAGGRMKKVMLLTAAGMCVLLGAVSVMTDKVRSRQEAEQKLEIQVLGEIHHERKYKNLHMWLKHNKMAILVTNPATSFSFVEKFRKLRRHIEQHMPQEGKTLLVTSVLENEGKSTVAVNLALSLAQKGKKVLLIDGDMQRPAVYKVLEQNQADVSLSQVLQGKKTLERAMLPCGKMKGLTLILEKGGEKNSTDLIGSPKMEELLQQVREMYDFVVIDTPPMSVVPDAESLADMVDGTLLVIRQNEAPTKMLNSALDALENTRARLLGCVLNNVYSAFLPGTSGGGYGYGYGHSYGYGGYGHYGHYGRYGGYHRSGSGKAGADDEQ